MTEALLGAVALISALTSTGPVMPTIAAQPYVWEASASLKEPKEVLASHELNLANRLPNEAANRDFADNILLTLRYVKGDIDNLRVDKGKRGAIYAADLDWEAVRQPFTATLTLQPGELFAYHDAVLPEFRGRILKTTKAHFSANEGFKYSLGLPGNGVCHLASLINWVATDSGLEVTAKVNHDFYPVPGVPRANGTSIRYAADGSFNAFNQNLYIVNNFDEPVTFEFKVNDDKVNLSVLR